MTSKGHQFLLEVKRLKTVERPRNTRDIEEARSHGDLSENAEFQPPRKNSPADFRSASVKTDRAGAGHRHREAVR
jgi:transcription elongation GreA/GreB family factor